MNIIDKLKSTPPKNLSNFCLEIFTGKLPSKWNQTETFISQSVACSCGNKENFLRTYEWTEKKGFFRKKVVVSKCSPAFLECPNCGNQAVLFNPEIHGWTGGFQETPPKLTFDGSKRVSTETGEIIVNYSYQGIENYEEIFEDPDIESPSDFFDTFSVYFMKKNGELIEVISNECA